MRVTYVKKARDPHGACRCGAEIKAGDSYYWIKPDRFSKRRIIRCSKATCRFRGSDLTTSDKIADARAAGENIQDFLSGITAETTHDEITSSVDEACTQIREVAERYEESVNNMPENLQNGMQAEEMNEKAQNLNDWADQLETAASEIEFPERNEEQDEEEGAAEPDAEAEQEPEGESDEDFKMRIEDACSSLDEEAGNCPL